jgi:hypothetical protein
MGLRVPFALLPLEHCSTKLLKQNRTKGQQHSRQFLCGTLWTMKQEPLMT